MTAASRLAGSTTIVSINTRNSHQTSPRPKELIQIADTMAMVWEGDLLDALAGFSDAEIAGLEDFKVKIKIPTPRIIEYTPVDGFTSSHAQGGATITYTMKEPQFEPQVCHEGVISKFKLIGYCRRLC